MGTVRPDKKVIAQLRRQLVLLKKKQATTRKQLQAALQKIGKNAGKSVRQIQARKLKKKT